LPYADLKLDGLLKAVSAAAFIQDAEINYHNVTNRDKRARSNAILVFPVRAGKEFTSLHTFFVVKML